MKRSHLSILPVSLMGALIACSSSSSSPTSAHDASATDGSSSTKDAAHDGSAHADALAPVDAAPSCPTPSCNLVGPSEVSSTLAIDVDVPVGSSMVETPLTVLTCDYPSTAQGDAAVGTFPLVIVYQYPFDSTMFAAERTHVMGATTVANVGTDAYYTDDTGVGELVVLAGCVEILIQSSATEDQLIALAQDLAPELTAGL